MDPITIVVIAILLFASFFAGVGLANWFNDQARAEQKEALEKQYLRLKAGADADDPCKPYVFSQPHDPIPGYGPISQEFMDELRQTGRARTEFRKGDAAS